MKEYLMVVILSFLVWWLFVSRCVFTQILEEFCFCFFPPHRLKFEGCIHSWLWIKKCETAAGCVASGLLNLKPGTSNFWSPAQKTSHRNLWRHFCRLPGTVLARNTVGGTMHRCVFYFLKNVTENIVSENRYSIQIIFAIQIYIWIAKIVNDKKSVSLQVS